MTTQRDLLRARRLPREDIYFPADAEARDGAAGALRDALSAVLLATSDEERVLLRKAADEAQRAFSELPRLGFTITALPPRKWEQLISEHPPVEKDHQWNVKTFRPAVCVACIVAPEGEAPFTLTEWNELVREGGSLSSGEEDAIFLAALQLNTRAVHISTGKG
jgi:hypothetical protein